MTDFSLTDPALQAAIQSELLDQPLGTTRPLAAPEILTRKTRALFDAIADRDYATLIELTSPRIEVHLPAEMPYGGVYAGHVGVANALQKISARWDVYEPYAEEIWPVASHTVTLGRLRVQAKQTEPKKESFTEVSFTLFTRFDGDVIVRTHQYSDTAALLRLLGEPAT